MIGSTSLTAGAATGVRIWLATAPLDMRRSFDALAEHVRMILSDNPMSGHLFVFRNRSAQRLKILWWDKDGYAIYYKRLERGDVSVSRRRGEVDDHRQRTVDEAAGRLGHRRDSQRLTCRRDGMP